MSFNEENLLPAKLSGIRFEVDSDSMPVGRRTADHEYPFRDEPYIEDMGRKKRVINLEAWVCGDDCLERRDRLIAVFEAKDVVTLVHPWYGEMQVKPVEATPKHRYDEGRVVRIEMNFVEAGELDNPRVTDDTASLLAGYADELQTMVDDALSYLSFDHLGLDMLDLSGAGRIIGVLSGAFNSLSQVLTGAKNPFISLFNDVMGLVAKPAGLVAIVRSMFGGLAKSSSTTARQITRDFNRQSGSTITASYAEIVRMPATLVRAVAKVDAQPAAANAALATIEKPLREYVQYTLVAQAAGVLSIMPAVVKDDVKTSTDAVVQAIDVLCNTASDEQYQALVRLRMAVLLDYHERISRARNMRTLKIEMPTPALVLAYNAHENALRDGEIILRNKVAHPLFVAGDINVVV